MRLTRLLGPWLRQSTGRLPNNPRRTRLIWKARNLYPQTEIRDLRAADIPKLVAALHEFHEQFDFVGKRPIDNAVAAENFSRFVDNPSAAALVAEDSGDVVAMLGFAVLTHPWTGQKVLYKAFWFARPNGRPGIGRKLLRVVIDMCRAGGIKQLNFGSMHPRVNKMLERQGFKASETNYLLEL